jgi:hypothetical protein
VLFTRNNITPNIQSSRYFTLNKSRHLMISILVTGMTKCKGPHHDFDDFTTYDFTTFTTSRLVIDLETHLCTVNQVSRSITSREVVKVVRS